MTGRSAVDVRFGAKRAVLVMELALLDKHKL
jgi:hypothetical protein